MLRFVDLFSGVGGIRLGAEMALTSNGIQCECVLSSEINPQAAETYRANFGDVPSGDIREISDPPAFDMLLAGFPCQPFSYAGKRQGFGDTRGTLFFEVDRLLSLRRPKAFLLENVRGLRTHDGGRTFATILDALQRLGYGVKVLELNSSSFGVPQNRVRLYVLGLLGATPKTGLASDAGARDSHAYKRAAMAGSLLDMLSAPNRKTVGDILESDVDGKYACSEAFVEQLRSAVGEDLSKLAGCRLIDYRGGQSLHSWQLGTKGKCTEREKRFMDLLVANRRRHSFGTAQDGKKLSAEQIRTFYPDDDFASVTESLIGKGYLQQDELGRFNPVCGNMSFEVFKFLDPATISITLTSSDCSRLGVVQNGCPRRITPRECARLQGFPDSFKLHPSDTYAYRQFGNSVSVPVIEKLLDDFIKRNRDALGENWK